MKKFSWIRFLFNAAMVALLFVGIGFRVHWRSGGPDSAYWLGETALSLFGVFTGAMIIIRTVNRKRIPLFLFGAVLTVMGTLLFLNTIHFIRMGCPPSLAC